MPKISKGDGMAAVPDHSHSPPPNIEGISAYKAALAQLDSELDIKLKQLSKNVHSYQTHYSDISDLEAFSKREKQKQNELEHNCKSLEE